MRRYTTPTIELTVEGVDLTAYDVLVSIGQSSRRIWVHGPDMSADGEDTVISVELTQEQSSRLREGTAKVQVNWLDLLGKRNATEVGEIMVRENLIEREL